MTTSEQPKRTMRFFQFTLRQLLVLFVAVAVLLSIFVPRWHELDGQRQRAKANRDLLEAAARGDVEGAARALAAGADVDEGDAGRYAGHTALGWAVKRRDLPS